MKKELPFNCNDLKHMINLAWWFLKNAGTSGAPKETRHLKNVSILILAINEHPVPKEDWQIRLLGLIHSDYLRRKHERLNRKHRYENTQRAGRTDLHEPGRVDNPCWRTP